MRASFFRALLWCALGLAGRSVVGQNIAFDEPHVTPRTATVDVASAAYSAPFGRQGLIRTSAELVLVPVTITDDHNRPVIGLDQENFQLFENKRPQQIKHFTSEDMPVSIGILVDTSGSMSYKLARAREAVTQFCDAANPEDEFFLITFSDVPRVAVDFTSKAENLENELVTTRSKGATSLLDAIYMGIDKMREAKYARKALLILSDGGDNHSRYNERDVKAAIREADVTLYAVGTYDRFVTTQEEALGPELLRTLAGWTGGQAFALNNANEMPSVTQDIGRKLRHQYMLAYQPQSASHDGRWHKISVKLRLPRKFPFLHVEARTGYYAGGE
jgi:Ca-activated chloride channel family protein